MIKKFLKWLFGEKPKPKKIEKKEEVIESSEEIMKKFMETGKNGERNWKPVGKGFNPWGF